MTKNPPPKGCTHRLIVIELGAGLLHSLLMGILVEHHLSDHPDKSIFENPEKNVEENRHLNNSKWMPSCYGVGLLSEFLKT